MSERKSITLEVCIDSVESALAAEAAGADRLELCDNLIEGGTTPSLGMVRAVRRHSSLDIMAMVRPRGGDFLYDRFEIESMIDDIRTFRDLGIRGVVTGILSPGGGVDRAAMRQVMGEVGELEVTFHRAFDMVEDPVKALEHLIELGVSRILTSGHEANAFDGRNLIAELVEQSRNRISIMAGAGINKHNVREIVSHTGIREVHVSARHAVISRMSYINSTVEMGSSGYSEFERRVTSEQRVRELLEAIGR